MSAMWPNRASLPPWLDRLINVGRVDPYYNHGPTTSSTSAVWIRMQPWLDRPIKVGYVEPTRFITTMVATSTLSMWSKKWASTNLLLDCFIYVGGAQLWSLLRSLVDSMSKTCFINCLSRIYGQTSTRRGHIIHHMHLMSSADEARRHTHTVSSADETRQNHGQVITKLDHYAINMS
jgi:hypothetical protein